LNKLRSKLAVRASAVANGVKLGRKPTLSHHQQLEAIKRRDARKETQGEIARSYNVSRRKEMHEKGSFKCLVENSLISFLLKLMVI
jgi:hypothetical protein